MRHLFFAAYHGSFTFVLPALNASECSKVCDEIVIVIVAAQRIQRKRTCLRRGTTHNPQVGGSIPPITTTFLQAPD